MSRTYRRRKGEKPGTWITHDQVVVDEIPYKRKSWKGEWYDYIHRLYKDVPRSGKDLREHLAIWHSDNACVVGSPPKWFVRDFCNKPFRAKAKAEIRRMVQTGDFEDYNFNPHKNNAMWNWW